MIRFFSLVFIVVLTSCNTGNLTVLADLPDDLKEVSAVETIAHSNLIWMLNDSGNSPKLYGTNEKGKLIKILKIDAKNNDWEDLTSDKNGNIYIGDFGNNTNKRKNLAILKVNASSLKSDSLVSVERISFRFSNQTKFPPKKKQLYFDCESFFYHNDSLYLFTRSRVKHNFGKTSLYKVPAKQGNYDAQLIAEYKFCDDLKCSITSADISNDGKKIVLLNSHSINIFSDFTTDNFFNGTVTQILFSYVSQKEGVCFKDDNTLFITDEKAHHEGGNLYELKLTN